MKTIKFILVGSLVIAAMAVALAVWYVRHVAPDYSGEVTSKELLNEVTVSYDSIGIPHIYAENAGDAFFALGYTHASERLFQMELLRRVGSGRLSEILGRDLLPIDKFFRSLGIGKSAETAAAAWDTTHAPWVNLCRQYLKGVNHFIDNNPAPAEFTLLGIEKAEFTPKDIYLITGYMAFSFAEALRTDPILSKIASVHGKEYLLPFQIDTSKISLAAARPAPIASYIDAAMNKLPVAPWIGSNGWVIAGSRSQSGKPILANDTHIGYQQPAVWYEAHLSFPGTEIYGHFLAGLPFPLTGHTPHHAWGLTMFENDDMNLYSELINGNEYKNDTSWLKLTVRADTIIVKDSLPEIISIRSTHRGPLVSDLIPHLNDSVGTPYSLWWSYTQLPATAPEIIYTLMNARTLADARAAASSINAPGLNIVYANTQGDIACWSAGKIPLFRNVSDTRFVLDGASGGHDPSGYLNFSENPQSENPQSGLIISANQAPANKNDSIKIYGYYAPNDRHDRIDVLLSKKQIWSPDESRNIQYDVTSSVQSSNARYLTGLIDPAEADKEQQEILKLLSQWNGEHQIENIEPTVWYSFLAETLHDMMADELGEFDFSVFVNTHFIKSHSGDLLRDENSAWWDNIATADTKETRIDVVTASFTRCINRLKENFGNDIQQWKWGQIHTLTHNHPVGAVKPLDKIYNVGPYPAPGGIETVNNAGFPLFTNSPFPVKYGAAMRNIIDMSDPSNAWSILPTGQSGHVGSDHYKDQAESYVNGIYRPMRMLPKNKLKYTSAVKFILSPL